MTSATAFSLLLLAVAWVLYALAARGSANKILESDYYFRNLRHAFHSHHCHAVIVFSFHHR